MSTLLAARTGDKVAHASSFWSGFGCIGGMSLGAILGAVLIAGAVAVLAVATAPLAIVAGVLLLGSAIAAGVATTAKLGAAGEKLGEHYDDDNAAKAPPSSAGGEPILEGGPTVFIENELAAHIETEVAHEEAKLLQGSATVFICNKNASRLTEASACGGKIVSSAKHTYIGGATVGEAGESESGWHKFAEKLEKVGDVAEKVSGVLFGAAALVGAAGVWATAGAMAGLASLGESALGFGTAIALSKGGKIVGGAVGSAADYVLGDKDGRWGAFGAELGEQTAGFAGEKVKDVAITPTMKALNGKGFEVPDLPTSLKGAKEQLGEPIKELGKVFGEIPEQLKEFRENVSKSIENIKEALKAKATAAGDECPTCTGAPKEEVAPPPKEEAPPPPPKPQLALPAPKEMLALPAPKPQLLLPAPKEMLLLEGPKECLTCEGGGKPHDFTNPDGSVRHGPMNPGRLDEVLLSDGKTTVGSTFRSNAYTARVLKEPVRLYRRYSDPAKELGPYWSTQDPGGHLATIHDSALDPAWGNKATNVTSVDVPAGTTVYEGVAAPQTTQAGGQVMGGGSQVYLDQHVDPGWKSGGASPGAGAPAATGAAAPPGPGP